MNDINEYSPVFKEKTYKATVIEGKKYDSILRVEAVDADCSFQYSQICNYEIVTPDVPFTIDKDGKDLHIVSLCFNLFEKIEAWKVGLYWHTSQCLSINADAAAAKLSFRIHLRIVRTDS